MVKPLASWMKKDVKMCEAVDGSPSDLVHEMWEDTERPNCPSEGFLFCAVIAQEVTEILLVDHFGSACARLLSSSTMLQLGLICILWTLWCMRLSLIARDFSL